ncbi:auxin-responsive protein SAUR71-like protein [Cinnamomum micranthum f. kanehirae]|uniref:Auxin-responsive protein SAUR71-like protein n=1 Tax=Cinnamomum micranthum f. kanehirae TaxID=337451 RepID=A0A3S3QQ33_9MAGN|nr:auxin-responsive protein SAUR71-like protein [Cinnamomum micranthum f. kanehirae]
MKLVGWIISKRRDDPDAVTYRRLNGEDERKEDCVGVPKGCVPVLVGLEEKMKRFVIHTKLFKHPSMLALLEMAEREFGYNQLKSGGVLAENRWGFQLKSGRVSAEIRWLGSVGGGAGGWTEAVQAEISASGKSSGWGQGSWFQVAGSSCACSSGEAAAQQGGGLAAGKEGGVFRLTAGERVLLAKGCRLAAGRDEGEVRVAAGLKGAGCPMVGKSNSGRWVLTGGVASDYASGRWIGSSRWSLVQGTG